MKEMNILKLVMLALSGTCKLFRINTGQAWTGNKITKFSKNHPRFPGAILIEDPRPLRTGTPPGYSDVTGWTPVEVTSDMVGQKFCVFTAIEIKSESGKLSGAQRNFIEQVNNSGGIGFISRDADDAKICLANKIKEIQSAGTSEQ